MPLSSVLIFLLSYKMFAGRVVPREGGSESV